MLKALFTSFFSSLFGFAKQSLREKRLRNIEFRQLAYNKNKEFSSRVDELENRLSDIVVNPVRVERDEATKEWNSKRTKTRINISALAVLVAPLFLISCMSTSYVERQLPVLPIPERPMLDESEVLTDNAYLLINYASTLEKIIEDYNHFAKEVNHE